MLPAIIGTWALTTTCQAAISFLPPTSVPLVAPADVTTADMDGDGHVDLIALGQGGLSIIYGKGDGTFGDRVTLPLGDGINPGQFHVLAADLNGDGLPDLVVPYDGLGRIAVLVNKGHGAFAPPVNYAVGTRPTTSVAGDFNKDGKLDLAVVNHGSHNMSVLLNRGDGSLLPAVFYRGGSYPGRLVTGDFDHDGNPDLAMSNLVSSNVIVYLGDGTGKFTVTGDFRTGADYAAEMTVDDFDGDGNLDLASSNFGGGNVSILRGDGSGTFAPPVDYLANGRPYVIFAPDLDGDGDPDIALGNDTEAHFTVLENDGTGKFLPALTIPRPGTSRAFAVADLNEDGRPDVVAGNIENDTLSIFLNNSPRPTPAVRSLTLTPSLLIGGCQSAEGRVTLTAPAPPGGAVISLTGGNSALTTPSSVSVREGATSATFSVTTAPVPLPRAGSILASFQGSGRRAAFAVRPGALADLRLSPNPVFGGDAAVGEVSLPCAAGPNSAVVLLGSSNTAVASTPATVIVTPGALSATFPLTTRDVSATTTLLITAQVDGHTLSATLEVQPTPPPPPLPLPSSTPGNLLVNGSFETPDTSASRVGYLTYGPDSRAGNPAIAPTIPGWRIVQGTIDVQSWYWQPQDGSQSIDLVGESPASIEQSFATTPGRAYRFSGWVAHNPENPFAHEGRANVYLNGSLLLPLAHSDPTATRSNMHWRPFLVRFQATKSTSTLTISDSTGSPFRGGLALDGLSVFADGGTGAPAALAAPTGLTARAVSSTRVQLGWTDVSSTETAFAVWRKGGLAADLPPGTVTDGDWARIAVLPPNSVSTTDATVHAGTEYTYRVRAVGTAGASDWSNLASVTTPAQ
jgi:hypothetical protein